MRLMDLADELGGVTREFPDFPESISPKPNSCKGIAVQEVMGGSPAPVPSAVGTLDYLVG